MRLQKKGIYGLESLGSIAIIMVVAAIIISMGGTILKDIRTSVDDGTNNTAFNVTEKGLTSMTTLAKWLPTIAIVVAAAVVIGIVVTSFRT